jgi:hypothetical protein
LDTNEDITPLTSLSIGGDAAPLIEHDENRIEGDVAAVALTPSHRGGDAALIPQMQ